MVGTDKDLRKLTKEDAINLLVKMGEDPVKMRALKRWDRVLLIREKSTQATLLSVNHYIYPYYYPCPIMEIYAGNPPWSTPYVFTLNPSNI